MPSKRKVEEQPPESSDKKIKRSLSEAAEERLTFLLGAISFNAIKNKRDGGATPGINALCALDEHWKTLVKLGYQPEDLATIANQKSAHNCIVFLAENTKKLEKLGFSIPQISLMCRRSSAARTIENLLEHGKSLLDYGYSCAELTDMFDRRNAGDLVEDLVERTPPLTALNVSLKDIVAEIGKVNRNGVRGPTVNYLRAFHEKIKKDNPEKLMVESAVLKPKKSLNLHTANPINPYIDMPGYEPLPPIYDLDLPIDFDQTFQLDFLEDSGLGENEDKEDKNEDVENEVQDEEEVEYSDISKIKKRSLKEKELIMLIKKLGNKSVEKISKVSSGTSALCALAGHWKKLVQNGFSSKNLARIAKKPSNYRIIDFLAAKTNDLEKLGFSIKSISKMCSHTGATGALSFLLKHHKELLGLGYMHKDLIRIFNRKGATNLAKELIQRTNDMTSCAVTIEDIMSVIGANNRAGGSNRIISFHQQMQMHGYPINAQIKKPKKELEIDAITINAFKGILSEAQIRLIKDGKGKKSLEPLREHRDTLKASEYDTEIIMALAVHSGAGKTIKLLAERTNDLKTLGFTMNHIKTVARNDGAYSAFLAILKYANELINIHKVTQSEIAAIAGAKNGGGGKRINALYESKQQSPQAHLPPPGIATSHVVRFSKSKHLPINGGNIVCTNK